MSNRERVTQNRCLNQSDVRAAAEALFGRTRMRRSRVCVNVVVKVYVVSRENGIHIVRPFQFLTHSIVLQLAKGRGNV